MSVDERLSLTNIGRGVAIEKFEREMQAVLQNIADPNTDAEAKRTITLTFDIAPDADRERLDIAIKASTKLASTRSFGAIAFMGRLDGEPVAINFDPRQLDLPSDNDAPKVTPFNSQKK